MGVIFFERHTEANAEGGSLTERMRGCYEPTSNILNKFNYISILFITHKH